ncbi:hypothetical protein [Paraburkholderia phytofirmans]|uniref:hypothetical protein n=1 Tax=Paraburkholderia phytofirmans TaxID=261302 RepID=UPI0011E003EF|nr:hypothetical protein [Paraburkholderia phytofirmans]
MLEKRIRIPRLREKVATAEAAALLFPDGMTVAASRFGAAGDCKLVPRALAARAQDGLRITLMTGASTGYAIDGVLAEARAIRRRIPYQNDKILGNQINADAASPSRAYLLTAPEQRIGHTFISAPLHREALHDYVAQACIRGGQTPHLIGNALAWHARCREHGTMDRQL